MRWSTYALVTGRKGQVDLHTRRYFDIADDPDWTYQGKMKGYRALADEDVEVDRLLTVVRRAPGAPARGGAGVGGLAGL